MSNRKSPTRFAKEMFRAPHPETGVSKNTGRIRARHGAITNNFDNWRSYKEWVEKMRGTWKEEK